MKRAGERGSGEWEQITWDEAFALMAEKISAAIDEYGGASVCFQEGGGNKSAYLHSRPIGFKNYAGASFTLGVGISRFMRAIGATSLGAAQDCAQFHMRDLLAVPTNSVEDLQNAKTIVVWGANPAEAGFTRSTWHWMCKARENGAKVYAIDPLMTPTAAQADQWLPVIMGTDSALMCAMANYIVENGLANEDYLRTGSVAPLLVDDQGTYIRMTDIGLQPASEEENWPVVWDEDAQTLAPYNEAATPALSGDRALPDGRTARTVFDATMENIAPFTVDFAAEECGIPAELIEELAQRVATEGPTTFFMDWGVEHTYNSWRNYLCLSLLAALTGSVGAPGASYNASRSVATTFFKKPVKVDLSCLEVENQIDCKVITGDYICEIMETGQWLGEDFPVRVIIMEATNPLDHFCDPNRLLEAYAKVDFIAVMDLFMTTTAHYADLVLPAAMPWEEEEFNSATGFFCQKAIEPVGDCKGDFDIYVGLAKAMGMEDLYPKSGQDYLREILDTPENLEAGLSYDAYRENGYIAGELACEPKVSGETNPLGLTQFYLESMIPREAGFPMVEFRDRLPFYEPNIEAHPSNPDSEKYPLYGFSNHDNFHGQGVHAHNAWLDEYRTLDGEPFCRIHEKAAAERGIKTGDKVRVFNDHGSCVLAALVTSGIQEKCVWMPHGFFWDEFEEGTAQSVTGHHPDPVTSNANYNDWVCQVEKL